MSPCRLPSTRSTGIVPHSARARSTGRPTPQAGAAPMTAPGTPMWRPSPARAAASEIVHYMQWLGATDRARVDTYEALWRWLTTDTEAFWASICEYFEVSFHQ